MNKSNKRIRALIVDDESLARKLIRSYADTIPELDIIKEFDNGVELLKELPKMDIDLFFLDIHMPKLNGFEILELLPNPPAVIFTTAYEQYALKEFEHSAVDYLLKPFSPERFKDAVKKVLLQSSKNDLQNSYSSKFAVESSNFDILQRIVVKDRNQIHFIPLDSIHYFEAQDDYVLIAYSEHSVLKQSTMKYFEEHLPDKDFVRIHRSYIVALSRIKRLEHISRENYKCVLKSGKKFPVSKSGMSKLKQIYST